MQALLGGPRADEDPAELREALSYRHGGTFRRRVAVLDLDDQPTEQLLPFTTGKVSYAYRPPDRTSGQTGGVTESRRRGSFEVVGSLGDLNLSAVRLQPFTELLLRSGRWARFDHAVLEPQNPGVADDGVVVRRTVQCVDKSARWAQKRLGAPQTVSGTQPVVALIRSTWTSVFGETAFAITASDATLGQARTFEGDTSYLDWACQLLEGIAYDQLTADEQGRPASEPLAVLAGRGAEAEYGPGLGKIVPGGDVAPLLPTLPNVLVFSARQGPGLGNSIGNGLARRVNQSTGPASIDARGGYEVEQTIEVDVDAPQSNLEAYADAEQQRYFAGGGLRFSGRIALNPLAGDRDVISITKPRLDMTSGLWLVTSWDLPMSGMTTDTGVLMPITAERRVV